MPFLDSARNDKQFSMAKFIVEVSWVSTDLARIVLSIIDVGCKNASGHESGPQVGQV